MPFLLLFSLPFAAITFLGVCGIINENKKISKMTPEEKEKYLEEKLKKAEEWVCYSDSNADYHQYHPDAETLEAYCQMGIAESMGFVCPCSHDE